MDLHVDVTAGPDVGRTFRYEGCGTVVFGRAGTPGDDGSRPTDPRVSREHLLLEVARDGIFVAAIRRDATFERAERPLREAVLHDGDEVGVGDTRLRLRLVPSLREPDPEPSSARAVPRRRLADYDVGTEIGRGTFGVVCEALDRTSGECVAMKRLRDPTCEDVVRRYFLREIGILAQMSHPNVVRTLAVGRDEDPLFLVMERVDGPDLARRVEASGPLGTRDAVEVGIALLRALAHAHAAGVVHRDVKPANVLLPSRGRGIDAKVADFGLARRFRESGSGTLTLTGETRGTVFFAAPECLRDAKRAGPAADVFGAGATLHHALTGGPWFDAAPGASVFEAVLEARVRPLRDLRPDVPASVALVVERALRAAPEERPSSAAAMLAELVAAAAGRAP